MIVLLGFKPVSENPIHRPEHQKITDRTWSPIAGFILNVAVLSISVLCDWLTPTFLGTFAFWPNFEHAYSMLACTLQDYKTNSLVSGSYP